MQSANNKRALSYSNTSAASGGWVWPLDSFVPRELSHLCDVHNPICSYQIIPSGRSPFSARNKMANIQQYLANSTVLRTDLQRNKVAQPSSELKEQHKMAWLFTGGRDGKQKKMPHILKSHHASLSLSSRYCCNLSHSYLILQEFPARLMCYWFQVSCYWNGGGPWGGGRGSRTTGSESKRLKEERREREKMEFCQRHYSIYPAHISYLIIYSIKSMISN